MHNGISAIILSGGKGSRMNHRNKGLITYQSQPLIQHVIERIAPQVDEISISANQDLNVYRSFGYPVTEDHTESLGPLSGILSAANMTSHSIIMIAPCDMPRLPMNLASRLLEAMTTDAISVSSNGQQQPLVAMIKRTAVSSIQTYLDEGGRSVNNWLSSVGGTTLDWDDDPEAFCNFNYESDLTN